MAQRLPVFEAPGITVTFDPPEQSEPVVPSQQAVLFYVYREDVAACRAPFEINGVKVGEIQFPFYAPRGEFRISDPDGFAVMVMHT